MSLPLKTKRRPKAIKLLLLVSGIFYAGCAVSWEREALYYEHAPRTILVLPPKNNTNTVDANAFFQTTLIKPLLARGYFVFPMEATVAILRQEGIDEGQIDLIAPQRLHQYLGADAVLYTTIETWSTTYVILATDVTIAMSYRLVDAHTGLVLWENYVTKSVQSHVPVSRDPLASLIASAVDAAFTATLTSYLHLASEANSQAFFTLPPGFYHPHYPEIQSSIQEWKQTRKQKS